MTETADGERSPKVLPWAGSGYIKEDDHGHAHVTVKTYCTMRHTR